MNLQINGNDTEVPSNIENAANLLTHLKLENKIVIVEVNGAIIEKGKHGEAPIMDGDKVEIVHFVGGG
ncbi:sulfur carrier protein ThiS [Priestia taiwanensis]|uniref:Sulfur carrier protein ThiS n=1 Tax=Priestia taiwanensis TaxID=1347902 RepID=A0A917EQR6_9BACI|nr:sulfur carrier protein ThiS [Priestia taiwanensis]MBM7363086.1 sulfur carrier protein [Priestia taiwanensis]GGE67588.1 sulfur carrier protein ThiS [Priestia taiwanensis]